MCKRYFNCEIEIKLGMVFLFRSFKFFGMKLSGGIFWVKVRRVNFKFNFTCGKW